MANNRWRQQMKLIKLIPKVHEISTNGHWSFKPDEITKITKTDSGLEVTRNVQVQYKRGDDD